MALEQRVEQLEKELAELKKQASAQPEEPAVLYEKVLPNGTKVVAVVGGPDAVGRHINASSDRETS